MCEVKLGLTPMITWYVIIIIHPGHFAGITGCVADLRGYQIFSMVVGSSCKV